MAESNLSVEEKKQLTNARQAAVRNAWKNEKNLVSKGQGTRNWTKKEQQELMKRGSVKGYDGHHMKSVSKYPQYAGDARNIQFLNEKEHYNAHGGNFRSSTNGYYNPENGKMYPFKGNELKSAPRVNLSKNTNNNTSATKNRTKDDPQKSGKEKSAEFRNSLKKTENTKQKSSSSANVKSNGNKR